MKQILSSRSGLKLLDDADGDCREIARSDPFHAGACAVRGEFVFAANTVPGYPAGCVGTLRSYSLGSLEQPISEQAVPGGRPAAVAVAPDGQAVLTASYFGACVCVFPVDEDGRLAAPRQVIHHTGRGVQNPRQQAAHPHDLQIAPDGSSILIPDLGTDSTWVYRYRDGELHPAEPAQVPAWPETGPRHACWRHDSRVAWVLGELNGLIHVVAHEPATSWTSTLGHASCLPPGYSGPVGGATLALHPSGQWLYASLRATQTIVRFRVEPDGSLSDPRHSYDMGMPMALHGHPDGRRLLVSHGNQNRFCQWALDDEGCLGARLAELPVEGPGAMALLHSRPSI